jgi:hypothetical protein
MRLASRICITALSVSTQPNVAPTPLNRMPVNFMARSRAQQKGGPRKHHLLANGISETIRAVNALFGRKRAIVARGVTYLTQPPPFLLLSCPNGRRPRAHDTDFNYHGCDLRNYDLCRIRVWLGPSHLAPLDIPNRARINSARVEKEAKRTLSPDVVSARK